MTDNTKMTDEELTQRQVAETMNGLLRGAWRGDEQTTDNEQDAPASDTPPDPSDMNVLLRAARWGVDPATAAERMRPGGDAE